jgi:hypothetical protein
MAHIVVTNHDLCDLIDCFELLCQAETRALGPYKLPSGRSIMIEIDDDGKRRTVSRPKWLMEQHLGRKLDPDTETVDHKDRDFNNDNLSNLRLVDRKQHSADDTRRVKLIKFKCPMCEKDFERSPRLIRDKSKKEMVGPLCSRQCSGRYARLRQLGMIDKLPLQPFTESEYYRNEKEARNLTIFQLILKYG